MRTCFAAAFTTKRGYIARFGTPEEIFTAGYIPRLYQMTTGSYEERTGNLELARVQGTPKVFVIAGNGTCRRNDQYSTV